MKPQFFATENDFRHWLDKNYNKETELLVGFYKVATGKPSMTWSQSVDQALCYGWIDGVRKSTDDESYTIRFTPRKSSSIWSAININKIDELTKKGLMKPAGFKAFEKRKEEKSKIYSHEQEVSAELSPEFEASFKANAPAWDFFSSQAPWYRKVMVHLVMSAKQEKTKLSRLEKLIQASAEGKRL